MFDATGINIIRMHDIPFLDGYRSIWEAAEIIGIDDRVMRRYIARGLFPGVRRFRALHPSRGNNHNVISIIVIPIEDIMNFKKTRDPYKNNQTVASIRNTKDFEARRSSYINTRRKMILRNQEVLRKYRKSPARTTAYRQFGDAYRRIYDPDLFNRGRRTFITDTREEGKYFELTRARLKQNNVELRFRIRKYIENFMHFPHTCGGYYKIVPDETYLWALACTGCGIRAKVFDIKDLENKDILQELSYFSYAHVLKLNKDIDDMLKAADDV